MDLGYSIIRGCRRALGALPIGFHYACSGFITWVLRDVIHYRKDVVMINLSRSFPNKKYKEIKQISKQFYKHLGDIFAESIWFSGCNKYSRLRKQAIATADNWEVIEEAYQNSPAVMILNSHQGNWEILGGIMGYIPEDTITPVESFMVVYKKLRSKTWDKVFAANRCSVLDDQSNIIESSDVLRYAVSHRKEKKIYVFITDQSPYRNATAHITKDFMHQRTVTMSGGAALAKMVHMSVFSMEIPGDITSSIMTRSVMMPAR
ncbi:MAG: hypothetical protein MJZ16_10175 [Bacteroidales bacterium]|nr:hypothetical protein [Bacteroidales bacterium]